jgi:chromosome partitioning protein
MKTIAIISQKGGSGKTTLALHLAVAAELAGKASVVLDLDPQASSAGWKDSRGGDEGPPPVVVSLQFSRLAPTLATSEASGADFAFIDSAPHSDQVASAAAKAADLILIPCRPGILDINAIATTALIVEQCQKPAFVVLNTVPPQGTSIEADARKAIAKHGLKVAPITLHQRAAYSYSLTDGRVAMEADPEGKAAAELGELYRWLEKQMKK